jgi:hypothetical protein
VQKEWCCFLAHAPFEQMHGSKFNMANYIHQILSYIVPFIENKIHLHSLRNRPEKAYLKLAFLPVESFNNQIKYLRMYSSVTI